MCRMLGRGTCALAVMAAAPVRSCLLFSISYRLGGMERQVKSSCGICFSLFEQALEQAKAYSTVLLMALPLCAQAPQAPLILRSTTRLVQLNVIVQDKKGNPVTDLQN